MGCTRVAAVHEDHAGRLLAQLGEDGLELVVGDQAGALVVGRHHRLVHPVRLLVLSRGGGGG
eukprot:scaffold2285_cov126-Isochrysis_galbana.AAC.1